MDSIVDNYVSIDAELQKDLEDIEASVFTGANTGQLRRRSTGSSARCWSSGGPPCRWRHR